MIMMMVVVMMKIMLLMLVGKMLVLMNMMMMIMVKMLLIFRLKRPALKKKYGLLSNYDDSVEMEAVESDEDDTLYEARSLRRSD